MVTIDHGRGQVDTDAMARDEAERRVVGSVRIGRIGIAGRGRLGGHGQCVVAGESGRRGLFRR